ncbi:MAG: isoprenylcysteine carboxylmethyltransferase family protein [Saprospiraceae bacterium]|nr:isoprenylcysteine carboxylmethyltransferase family protein [Saprospiraceae bacterium]
MKNLRLSLLYLFTDYILPLLPRSEKLLHWKLLLLMLACIVMLSWANPEIKMSEGKRNVRSDRGTMLGIFFMGYLAVVAPVLEWGYFVRDGGFTFWSALGIGLMTGGLWFRIFAIQALGRHFTGVVQQVIGHQLITTGPYRWIRHPSYLGSVLAFVGCAVLLEAWWGLVICLVAMAGAYFFRIAAEERLLIEIFGNQYLEYRKRTWRLLPLVW